MKRFPITRLLGLAALLWLLGLGTAQAGNIWLTGHDADLHCAFGAQCNHFGTALDFVRKDAPDPTKPLLFLTNNGGPSGDMQRAAGQATAQAANTIEGAGNPFPFVEIDLDDATAFADTTFSTDDFSAVAIASHTTCGGCDLTDVGINAINARTAELETFFNAGGGLAYFAGASRSGFGAGPNYYETVPIPATGVAVSPPFTLTTEGEDIGLIGGFGSDSDTNCCATHNSFELPGADSALIVAETDSAGFAETLFAGDVTIGEGGFEPGDGDGDGGPSASVPEPSTFLLLGMGMIGMMADRRLRRRR